MLTDALQEHSTPIFRDEDMLNKQKAGSKQQFLAKYQ
jgi:hypothetical protein